MMKRWLAAGIAALLALGGLSALAEEDLSVELAPAEYVLTEEGEAAPQSNALPSDGTEAVPEATDAQVADNAEQEPDPAAVAIDKANFPDSRFRSVVSKQLDADGDGVLSGEEIDTTVILDVSGKGISKLSGIQFLTKLEYLYCQKNKLKKLDVRSFPALKYLDCSGNRLTKLTLGKRRSLEYLNCSQNKLKALDVSRCAALSELNCANNRLSKLDVQKNAALIRLDCRKNKLRTLDVSQNGALMALTCQGNPIAKLNVKKLPDALRTLAAREDLRDWNDKELFWSESEDHLLVLPASTKVTNGKQLIHKKGYYEHIYVGKGNRKKFSHLSDAQYANFRNVATTGMGKRVLYRSSSPLYPKYNRNKHAMTAMKKAGIRSVINMMQGKKQVLKAKAYKNSYYSTTVLWAKKMNLSYMDMDFKKNIASICRFMVKNDGPYLTHCQGGRDRTVLFCALLECLMGASAEEVIRDYQVTYYNFNGIRVGSPASEYIAYTRIRLQLARAFGIGSITDPQVSLSACAEKYLRSCGLKANEIDALKARLAVDY